MEGLKQKKKSREKRVQEFRHNLEPFLLKKNGNHNISLIETRNEKYEQSNKSNSVFEELDNKDLISKNRQKIQNFQKMANFHTQSNFGKFMELSTQFNVKKIPFPIKNEKSMSSTKFTEFFSKLKQQSNGSKYNNSYLMKSQNSTSYLTPKTPSHNHNKNIYSIMQIENEEKEEIYNFKTPKARKINP